MNIDAIIQFWDRVRTSLSFIPSLMVIGAIALAASTPAIDAAIPESWPRAIPLLFSGGAVGARAVLTTIATSMIGVAGVVFSMTIVSLQLASSQFGPRLLRTFLRDRGNQVVLGTFLGTFVYCVVVLPMVDTAGSSVYVPHIAVTIAELQAVVSLAMLVYYINHVAQSIHADAVMHSVGRELESVVDQLFPHEIGDSADECHETVVSEESLRSRPHEVFATRSGYLRFNRTALRAAAAQLATDAVDQLISAADRKQLLKGAEWAGRRD